MSGGGDKQVSGSRLEANRAWFKRYKEDVQKEGKPFFPFAVFHDSVMALVVVGICIGLACIWYFTVPGHGGYTPGVASKEGWLGPLYDSKADPGTTSFIPRPDWYFYFLFYLLRVFKWPATVVLGTVIVPTICLVFLIGLPFYDQRRERRPSRRPVAMIAFALTVVAMGLLTYKGATAKEALGSEALLQVPTWVKQNNLPPEAVPGAKLFAQAGCLNCHQYLNSGASNLGAPNLSDIGKSGRSPQDFAAYVADPSVFGNNVMPKFAQLGQQNLLDIGTFLYYSRGGEKAPPPKEEQIKGDAAAGKEVFTSAGCASCHTLKDAGATGTVGPNLDELKPSAQTVKSFVTHGGGPMPAFGDQGKLTEQQINDVAVYVSSVAGK